MENPMGEARKDALRLNFDRRVQLKFLGSKVPTDAGLLAYRELDEAFALTEMVQDTFEDSRLGSNRQHQFVPLLRRGNHHSAKFWRRALLPAIERYRHLSIPKFFRDDAAFANPALYRVLAKAGYHYAIRITANAVLEREIEHLLTRPVGRPSRRPKAFYHSFQYQAASWHQPRRVVAKVEWHQGELFPRVGFVVTNLNKRAKNVVEFYNGRGTAEQRIKEGKNAIKWTKLSCRTFNDNQTRLQLFALAYNLANFLRRLALPRTVKHWSLTTLREKLIKIGAKVVSHSRYVVFQMAEVAVPRTLFHEILGRIAQLRASPELARAGRPSLRGKHGSAVKKPGSRSVEKAVKCWISSQIPRFL